MIPARLHAALARSPFRKLASHVAREPNAADLAFRWTTALFALGAIATLVALGLELVRESAPSLSRFGARFFWDTAWDPVHERFGALPFLYGTLVSSLLALAIAVPVGLGVAIFLAELAPPRLRAPAGFLVELLAAVPSVVYGMWGLFVLAPWLRTSVEPFLARALGFLPLFRGPPQGVGMLAGGLILSVMILPTISAVSREVLAAVPASLREGALALGATQWESIRFAVLPYARSGIFGAAVLGLGRALGETMAVTMVIGNRPEISASLFAPGYTMASVIANEFTEATGDVYLAALTEVALLLFAVTLLLNLFARLLVRRTRATSGLGRI